MHLNKAFKVAMTILIMIGISASVAESLWSAREASPGPMAPQGMAEVEPRAYLPIQYKPCPGFFDNFSDPGSGWPIGVHALVDYGYLGGEYRIYAKSDGYFFYFVAPTSAYQDYTVEVDGRWSGDLGDGFGIVFGVVGDFEEYYLFDISTSYQAYRVLYRGPGGWDTVVSQTSDTAIISGNATNELKVARVGSQITLYVNDELLQIADDSRVSGPTRAGVVSSSKEGQSRSDARFDNYETCWLTAADPVATNSAGIVGAVGQDVRFDNFAAMEALPPWSPPSGK